jgi:hypothetical protein
VSFGAVESGEEGLDSFFVGVLGAGEICSDISVQAEGQLRGREIKEVSYVAKPDLYTPLLMSL